VIGGNAIGIIFRALFPGPVGLLYQVPLAAAVAWVVLRREAPDRGAEEHLWPLVGAIGAGGPLALFVVSRMPLPGAPLLALAAHWIGVSLLLDHYLDVDFDQSYGLTGEIVGPAWLLTVIIGAVLIVLSA
jgi:hypothetical protein